MTSAASHLDPALHHFTGQIPEMVELISDLVGFDTPTGNPKALARFLDHYRGLLENAGASTRMVPGDSGPLLIAELEAPAEGIRNNLGPLLLVGHSDTVWGINECDLRPPEVRDGRLYGPGVLDMKASLGLLVFLLRYLRSRPCPRPLRIFLSSDEEAGSLAARPHLESVIRDKPVALVLEPPREDGGLKVERKGVGIYRLSVRGRPAHAGVDPHRGINAVDELVRQILEITRLRDPGRGISVNVGRVGGGIASNVIPDGAWAEIDIRFDRAGDGEMIDRRLRTLSPYLEGAELTLKGGVVFPPMEAGSVPPSLVEQAREIASRIGIRLGAGSSGGGSDGSFLASRGIPTLDGLGVDGTGAHSLDEHILLDCLAPRAALLALLVLEIRNP